MSDIKRYDVDINWSREDWCLEEFEVGDVVKYEDHAAIVAQLEQELAKVTARYNCVRDMTPEDFGDLSTINNDFDSQVDAMIKSQQDHIPDVGKMVQSQAQQEPSKDIHEAITLLSAVFDAWENGTDCYDDFDGVSGSFIGKAFNLDDEIFKRCCDLLNRVNPREMCHRHSRPSKQGCKECDGQTYMHSPTGEYLGECPYCTKEQDPYAYDVPTEDGTELAYAWYYGKYKNKLPEGAIPLYLKSQSQQEPVGILNHSDIALLKQWFNAVQDLNPKYLNEGDFQLLAKLQSQAQQPKEQGEPCANSDSWNCKYCGKTKTCKAIDDDRNYSATVNPLPPAPEGGDK